VAYPAGTQQGDLLLLVEVNSANQAITTPSGWTLLADQGTNSQAQFRLTVWWRTAGSESSTSLSVHTNSSGATAWVARYARPAGSPAPMVATNAISQGTANRSTALTPTPDLVTTARATVISIVAVRDANALSLANSQGFALDDAPVQSSSGQGAALGLASHVVEPGSVTTPTWAQADPVAQWAWATVAFA
jgi:hypothetical protein